MSNYLGQLYATTKNAEKYIVLNSNNVELSGNVEITNGAINFTGHDDLFIPADSGIVQKVQDLSNNLLISKIDASFNNVDISGDLNVKGDVSFNNVDISGDLNIKGDVSFNNLDINGTIRLPDSSNNGYGVSGEILISQGNNKPPIWKPLEAPSYISWKLASDITLNNNNLDSDGLHRVKNITMYTLSQVQQVNNITYSTTTGEFTIITPGLYNYSFTAAVRPLSPSSGERYIAIYIYVNNTVLAITTGVAVYVESNNWNRNNICLNNIAYLNAGDIIHFKVSPSREDYNATLTLNETNGFLVKIA